MSVVSDGRKDGPSPTPSSPSPSPFPSSLLLSFLPAPSHLQQLGLRRAVKVVAGSLTLLIDSPLGLCGKEGGMDG